ncbi:MAG TPA: hybrid sensor histidine kinase/response regulator [Spirochaetes bacterium]|nr:hybrid sensor histidine kinase/response regulator [Spirochaetota bacterium]
MVKVLIIEDEDHHGAYVKNVIERKYPCDWARDGIEAKRMLSDNKYDIVIYDLLLPGISGKDLIHFTREEVDPNIVNIVITAYEEEWPPIESTSENIFYYMKKGTFKPAELLKVMDNAAELRKLRLKEATHIRNIIASEKFVSTGKLAVSIAHEINNPLQSMVAITDIIKQKIATMKNADTIQRDFDIIEKSVERIKGVIKQLTDLHSIDHKLAVTIGMCTIVEKVVSFIRPVAKEKHVFISMRDTGSNVKTYISESQFFHLLLTLFLDLLDTGSETIDITTKKEKGYAVLEIRTVINGTDPDSPPSPLMGMIITDLEISKSIIDQYNGIISFCEQNHTLIISIKLPEIVETTENEITVSH